MVWRSFYNKYGSLFFGRRIEQAVGRFHAFYATVNTKEEYRDQVDVFDYMLHEEAPETSFEQERIKAIEKKSA